VDYAKKNWGTLFAASILWIIKTDEVLYNDANWNLGDVTIEYENIKFIIENVDKNRIEKVRILT